jgi:hypothetical protein
MLAGSTAEIALMSIQKISATLIPPQFKKSLGQVSGGGLSSQTDVLEQCFSIGRVKNLYPNGSVQKTKKISTDIVFGGYIIPQFGHFIIESLGRLPSITLEFGNTPIIFFAYGTKSTTLLEWQSDLFRVLGVENEILILDEVTYFENLLVPTLHFHQNLRPFGDKVGRQWVKSRVEPSSTHDGQSIYVSRSKLPDKLGRFENEQWLEKVLVHFGYKIVHPQEISVDEQVTLYRDAKNIIVAESSAIHLMNLVCDAGQNIVIIQRRPEIHATIRKAVKYFSASTVFCINAICDFTTRNVGPAQKYSGIGKLDFVYLCKMLTELNFIPELTENASGLTFPNQADISIGELANRESDHRVFSRKVTVLS